MSRLSPYASAACVVALVLTLALAFVLTGCSANSGGTEGVGSSNAQESTTPSADDTSVGRGTQGADLAGIDLKLVPVVAGLDQPLYITHAEDGSERLFVVEQGGLVKVVRNGRVAAKPFLDLSGSISSGGERGLLGLAFAPDYEHSGELYVNYTDRNGDTVVERYTAEDPDSDAPAFDEPDELFTQKQPFSNHNGGCVMFAPDDTLWVGMGDGGSSGDPGNRAQNPKVMLGKMLSFAVAEGGIPKPKVVMTGLRNPWRFSFDRETDDVWIGDVGQNAWEEINFTTFAKAQGHNWGWNRWEGNHVYPAGSKQSKDGFSFPVIEYPASEGNSVTGGYVYRGDSYPALDGVYVYGDFVRGWIAIARRSANGSVQERVVLRDSGVSPSSFGESEDGELFVCDYNGRLLQVTAR